MVSKAAKLKALRYARERIEQERTQFICHALPHTLAGRHIREFIMGRLDYEFTYEAWARNKSSFKAPRQKRAMDALDSDVWFKVAKEGRLRWIDAMIKSIETDRPVQGDWK